MKTVKSYFYKKCLSVSPLFLVLGCSHNEPSAAKPRIVPGTPQEVQSASLQQDDVGKPSVVPEESSETSPLTEFETLFLPLWQMPEDDARSQKTCAQLRDLTRSNWPLRRSVPPGVEPESWDLQVGELVDSLEAIEWNCVDKIDTSDELADLFDAYQKLKRLLPSSAQGSK